MKIKNIYLLLFLMGIIVSSCFDDLSTTADFRYPDIVLNTSDQDLGIAYYNEQFTYEPEIVLLEGNDSTYLTGADYDNYSYEWRIALSTFDTVTSLMSTDRVLDVNMNYVQPQSSKYYIKFKVTDKSTSMVATFMFSIKVASNYGEGILIAGTDDGETSDISLIMAREFNGSFDDDSEDIIHKGIYSSINGNELDGVVNDLACLSYSSYSSITALVKGEHVYNIDPVTYEMTGSDLGLFYYDPEVFNPTEIAADQGTSYLINNGLQHYYFIYYGQKYSHLTESPYSMSSPFIINTYGGSYFGGGCIAFDKNTNGFMAIDTYGQYTIFPSNTTGVFDPSNIPDMELVYGDVGNDKRLILALMKSKTNNKFYLYELHAEEDENPYGKTIYDLSACTNIQNSTSYAISEAFAEMYYSVGNVLHVAILTSGTPSSLVSYTLPANEEITHVVMHKGGGETTWNEGANSEPIWRYSENNLLILVSYDAGEKESYVRTLPIQYGGRGGIADEKYIKKYEGFGKITAVATQGD